MKNEKFKKKCYLFWRQFELQSMIFPGLIVLLIFCYVPMYGITLAFRQYAIGGDILNAEWIGLKYFKDFFTDGRFLLSVRNTLGINIIDLIIGFPAPVIFAILLNELRNLRFKKITQTLSYLPYFISTVIFTGLIIRLLAENNGFLNSILVSMNLIDHPVAFLAEPKYFWWIFVITSLIKNIGWGAIIYIAAIAGVDVELLDAATIDGAGRFRRIWNVIIPSISGTIIIFFLLRISAILNSGFEQVWMLQNSLNIDMSETIDTYVYKIGIGNLNFSYATAVGLARSVIAVVLLVSANAFSRKFADKGLF